MRRSITKAVLAAALSLALPLVAQAAGLGRLTLLSSLGQPLNAEIEIVSLQAGEEDGLTARLASPQAFAQAGIDANPVLSDVRFSIERRGTTPVLRMRSSQPINEPFLELLVELTWSSGRLVREYTFLLDPPEYKTKTAIAAAPPPAPAAAEPKPAAAPPPAAEAQPAPQPEAKPEARPIEAAPAPSPAPSAEAAPPATPPAEAAPPGAAPPPGLAGPPPGTPSEPTVYEVRKGDTLGQIARQNLPPGITLNQMLIALYRANESAFIRKNVNLVRAGRILNIPDADTVGTVDRAEADRIVKEHMAQFAEYRSRLAAALATAEAAPGQQASTGRIEPKPAPPAPAAQDQLRLSKVDPAKPGAAATRAAREDDLAARDRALKEAQSRVTDLEKNAADLRKLLELKNQQLAELEKKAAAKPAAPAPAAPPPTPAPAKPPAEAPKPAAEAPKPAPAEAAKPAPAPEAKKAEPQKPEAKKPAAAPPPPAPGVIDEFLDNPLYLGLLGGLLVLLGAYGYIAWRRKKMTQAKFQDSVLGAATAGAVGGTAPLGAPTGGGPAAGPAAAPGAAPAAAEGEEVDPIAEADVYMAYGRDAQAEEILKEALQKDSKRTPVHGKLLEIYAHRKDAKSFEQTALKLKNLTNGSGAEWDKAAALGRSIDPQNGLYGGSGAAPAAPAAAAAAPAAAAPTLDFDLGGGTNQPAAAPDIALDTGGGGAGKETSAPALDFDLGGAPAAEKQALDQTQVLESKPASAPDTGMDFNLDLGGEEKPKEAPKAEAPKAPAAEPSGGLDFDLNLDVGGAGEKKTEADKAAPAMDLSAISLDLGSPAAPAAAAGSADPKWQEVATKLDLAKAYEEMGDKDGARELLNEVMKDGDAAQKGTAQQLLAKLG